LNPFSFRKKEVIFAVLKWKMEEGRSENVYKQEYVNK